MKINKKDIKMISEILVKIPYNPVVETCKIAIPIETEEVCDFDGLELTVKNTELGVKRQLEPVLLLDKKPTLAYADIRYSRNFNIFEYCDLLNISDVEGIDELKDIDVLLVDTPNIFMSFNI